MKTRCDFEDYYDLLNYYKDFYGDLIYKTGIYKMYFIQKPEYFYIGMATRNKGYPCTCGFNSRWRSHLSCLAANKHRNSFIQNMYNLYGFNSIKFEIWEFCTSDLCPQNELKWFELLKPPTNFQGNKKYIKTECIPDGVKMRKYRSGFTHSEETKVRMSNAQIGRIYIHKSLPNPILNSIIGEINNGETISFIARRIHKMYQDLVKDLTNYIGQDKFNELKNKSYQNSRDKINKKNVSRTENKNEKYADIIPIIIDKYRQGYKIAEIREFVCINEDLIGVLIKDNLSKEEIKKLKSINISKGQKLKKNNYGEI